MKLKTWILKSIDRIPISQTLWLSAISVCAGLTTGLGVWIFKRAIDLVQPGMNAASVRRGSQIFIPHGDTVIGSGDILVIAAEGEARKSVLRLCEPAG